MAIRIEQPGISKLYTAAGLAGQAKAEERAKEQAKARKEEMQMQQDYQRQMKLLDTQLDLEMYERSKRWEIEKMELASRMDFARSEGERQRKLESIDNKLLQLEKEKDAGHFSMSDRAYVEVINYWEAQRDFIETGVKPPTIAKEYGVDKSSVVPLTNGF